MKLLIYKGFSKEFYNSISIEALLDTEIKEKIDVLNFNSDISDQIQIQILLKKGEEYWLTYEEFCAAKEVIEVRLKTNPDSFSVTVIDNNIYPKLYVLPFEYDNNFLEGLINFNEQDRSGTENETTFLKYYSDVRNVNGIYYASYYNEEVFSKDLYITKNLYDDTFDINEHCSVVDYVVDISNDLDRYIEHLQNIEASNYESIGVIVNGNNYTTKSLMKNLKALVNKAGIEKLFIYDEILIDKDEVYKELVDIAKNELRIPNFKEFKKIRFYKNPLLNNETVDISQSTIIKDMINQATLAIEDKSYKDVFITASTGAGKSVIFQIPAIYMAKKYNQLTIIIEPIKALMVDQVDNIKSRGYGQVAYINGDITVDQKEDIIEKVKASQINILYLSPETLLSYSIDSIIGEREIGMLIVDEAHIVTTWGVGFRPDYWFLGNYINNVRKETNNRGLKDKSKVIRKFPICTFTATAVVGGIEDTVNDTIISLYMNDPIKYIGDVRRDNIKFSINVDDNAYGKSEYDTKKVEYMKKRIINWVDKKEKTIIYFPYNKTASQAFHASGEFTPLKDFKKKAGIYTGQIDADEKNNSLLRFKNNDISVMYATKAFGMGIDIDDIDNVYHFAVSGSLSDYVQEIGRCARKKASTGYAITDYLKKDMNYMQSLFGMSSIKHFHINSVLSILYNVYCTKKNRRFLITPRMFDGVFGRTKDDSELESKLKIALLMLEKDFYDKYQFKVIIARPRTMFSTAFMCVEREHKAFVENSRYWKYFNFYRAGRDREPERNGVLTSDMGDIYIIDLKTMWEEIYPNKSFAEFKYSFYSSDGDVFKEVKKYVHPRQMLTVTKTKSIDSFEQIAYKCKEEIDFICDKLNELKGDYFSVGEFEEKLHEKYGNTIKAKIISQSFINIVDPSRRSIKTRIVGNGETEYLIQNGVYRTQAESMLYKSNIYKSLIRNEKDELIKFIDKDNDKVKHSLGTLKILSLLDLITYELLGGDNPEIYIFISDPEKVRKIVHKQVYYKNNYVDLAIEKHTRSVKIMDYFFRGLDDDKTRWDFIEDYFLGEDVLTLDKYKYSKSSKIEHRKVINCIDKDESFETNGRYEWSQLEELFIETYIPIIKRLAANGVSTPDFINVKIKLDAFRKITPMMIWKEKEILVFNDEESQQIIEDCKLEGWMALKMSDLNELDLKEMF